MVLARLLIVAGVLLGQQSQDKPPLLPEPDANLQKDKLKLVKDLFKDEYAKRAPADQVALARKLLSKGLEEQEDHSAKFVLLREDRDLAAGAGDLDSGLQAADALSKSFAVDGLGMKMAVLAKSSAVARDPEAARAVARAYLSVAAEAVRADDYDAASNAASKAEAAGKSGQEQPLVSRAQELARDLGSIKSEYQKVKPWLEKPGTGDAEAAGRFLCFVRGDWDAGLTALAGGGKPPLKGLAERDLAKPTEPDKRADVADGWWELAQKEKSPWRKARIAGRAQFWYEQALPGSTGLVKVKVEKRLAELEDALPGAVNLLRLVDPRQDGVQGDWAQEGQGVSCAPGPASRLQLPYVPPDEYDLTVIAERREGGDAVVVGLARGNAQFITYIDAHPVLGYKSGLELLDGKLVSESPSSHAGALLANGKPSTFQIAVRKGGITFAVDGKTIVNWQGNYGRLTNGASWKVPNAKALFIGAWGSRVHFSKISLTPISGQGKKLR